MRGLVITAGLLWMAWTAGRASAEGCTRGAVIYRQTVTALKKGEAVDNLDGIKKRVFEVRKGGAWEQIDDGKVTLSGCFAAAHFADFKDALKKAKLKINHGAGGGACIQSPSRRVLVELPGRKKRKEVQQPCGPALDQDSERLGSCLFAAMDPAYKAEDIAYVCKNG